ncbi:MAG: hypothetical protein KDC67_17490, partial [Ignavibacteriae bacterium]|nr:hypothetical protein [Ignavibacteriota bacterium]
MVNFIVYSYLFFLFPEFFETIGKNIKLSIVVGAIFYIAGLILYPIEAQGPLLQYKMLLSGHNDIFRFPILQYMPVFLFGLNMGWLLRVSKNAVEKRKIIFKFIAILAVLPLTVFILQATNSTIYIQHFLNFDRWPPSLPFLALGVAFSLGSFFVVIKNSNIDKIPYAYEFLIKIGKSAYLYYIVHLVLLQIYEIVIGHRDSSPVFYLVATFILFILTTNIIKRFSEKDRS